MLSRPTGARPRPRVAHPRRLAVLVGALVLVLLPAVGQAAPARRVPSATLTVSQAVARPGETVVLRGRVPAASRRAVVLERRTSASWSRVDRASTSTRGSFRFVTRASGVRTQYRVKAMPARVRGRMLPAVLTPTRTVAPMVPPVGTPPTPPSTVPPTAAPGVAPTTEPSTVPGGFGVATRASASSATDDGQPQQVLGRAPGADSSGWISRGETTGSWIELAWDRPELVRRIVVERDPLADPGVTSGYLSFDDGSSLQVALSTVSPVTVLPFTARRASSVRFTVTGVAEGTTAVRLRAIQVQAGPEIPLVDVSTDALADGDVAPLAAPTVSSGDAGTLVDGGVGGVGGPWSSTSTTGAWVRLDWASPRELTTLSVAGTSSGAQVKSGTLQFSDGSTLPLGAVTTDPTRPTVLSFMPRVARWVRLSIDSTSGSGQLRLAEVSILQKGATALRTPGGSQAPYVDRPVDCSSTRQPTDATALVVLCPTNGTRVGDRATVTVGLGPSYTSVQAAIWPAQGATDPSVTVTKTPGAGGRATFDLDLSALPIGPLTVNLVATSPSPTAKARKIYLGLYRAAGPAPEDSPSPTGPSSGRSLVWSEEFDRSLALSRDGKGMDYATAKPEYWGPTDFGAAIFSGPGDGLGNVRVVDDRYLKISVQPKPDGYADFMKWDRTRVGGMLASARPGGSGFSAQYGYYEARMLLPAGTGTWPAFWMLPSPNLVAKLPTSAEIDALEHYGNNPAGSCHTTHQYPDPGKTGVIRCGQYLRTDRQAAAWHTYGVAVEPTRVRYFIDGSEVASAPQVTNGGDPMFWMVNLSLGGGYPIDLAPTQDRTDLYVDYVRVYV